MLLAFLILFSSCVSANGCSPYVNAKPTTVVVTNCSSDNMCSSNEFCYVSTSKNLGGLTSFGICVPCFDCTNKYQRKSKGSCSKSLKECGPCLIGFEEIGGHCIQINQTTTTTSTISYSTKNEIGFLNKSKNVTGDNYEGTNVWVIVSACVAGLLLLPACIGLLFLGRKHWKRPAGNDPRDEANLIELGGGRRPNNVIVPKPPDIPSAPEEEYERPPPTYIESIRTSEPRSNNGNGTISVRAEVYQNAPPVPPLQIYYPSRNPSNFRSRHNMVEVDNENLQMANPFDIGNAPGDWANEESYADLEDFELLSNNIVVNNMEVVEDLNSDHLVPSVAPSADLNCDPGPVNNNQNESDVESLSLSMDLDDDDDPEDDNLLSEESINLSPDLPEEPQPIVLGLPNLEPSQPEAIQPDEIAIEAMELSLGIRFVASLYRRDGNWNWEFRNGNNSLLSNDSGTSSSGSGTQEQSSFSEVGDDDSFYD